MVGLRLKFWPLNFTFPTFSIPYKLLSSYSDVHNTLQTLLIKTLYLKTHLLALCQTKLLIRRNTNGFCLILTKGVNLKKKIIQPEQQRFHFNGMDEHKWWVVLYSPTKPAKHLEFRAHDEMATDLPCDSLIIKTRKSSSYLMEQQWRQFLPKNTFERQQLLHAQQAVSTPSAPSRPHAPVHLADSTWSITLTPLLLKTSTHLSHCPSVAVIWKNSIPG